MRPLSLRFRLTLWYGGVLALLLAVLGTAVYALVGYSLLQPVDVALLREFDEIRQRLRDGAAPDSLCTDHHDEHHQPQYVRVSDAQGLILVQSDGLRQVGLPAAPVDPPQWDTVPGQSGPRLRVVGGGVLHQGRPLQVQVAMPLAHYDGPLDTLRAVLWMVLPAGFLLAVGGGYWLAGRALAPLQQITATTRRITAHNLQERIQTAHPQDELGQLAATLNAMMDRLADAFTALQQFTADASHELRTPLAALRSEVEIALRSPRSAAEHQQILMSVLEEAERLSRLADQLLLLSQEDAATEPPAFAPVCLDELVRDAAGHVAVLAEQAGVILAVEPLPPAIVDGDADRLRQVFFNILDNAVKYNRPEGWITVSGQLRGQEIVIQIRDTGIGIPAHDLPHIFDRFYRVDKSRSRRLGGAGLGLSIAKALVERHCGMIAVESAPGQGTTVRITLPLAASPSPAAA